VPVAGENGHGPEEFDSRLSVSLTILSGQLIRGVETAGHDEAPLHRLGEPHYFSC
jgi:hypothetical protein